MAQKSDEVRKIYDDVLYDAVKKEVVDANQQSFSHTFFLAQPGNAVKDYASLMLADPAGVGAPFMPQAGSPLLTGASFTDTLLSGWFAQVSYIGAFAANDNWLTGWTCFDPQNMDY